MAEAHAAFVGSIPEKYDRYLGPVLFRDFGEQTAARLEPRPGMRVLETACGTGIVTRRLLAHLGGQGRLVATDLNDAMLAYAELHVPTRDGLEWRAADATHLPFDDRAFDAVVCQFGVMFFPDRAAGMAEAFRVLRPGGRVLVSVWDRLEDNPVQRITHETVATFFASDAPQFYTVPSSMHDVTLLQGLLDRAGFVDVAWEHRAGTGTSPSAHEAAVGLIEGNPIYLSIMERQPAALGPIKAALAANLAAVLGDRPLRCPLRMILFTARRPG
jgi:ubiquinone/menaquinone biosynthesis C-methylase UbiE